MLAAPHLHNPLTLLRFAALAVPAMLVTVTSTPRHHTSYYSHHRVSKERGRKSEREREDTYEQEKRKRQEVEKKKRRFKTVLTSGWSV